jgi:hypothetical protein
MDEWAERQLPYLAAHQFSLVGLPEPLRQEVLYGLQQADPWLRIFEPCQVRRLVRDLAGTPTLTGGGPDGTICPYSTTAVLRLFNRVRTAVKSPTATHIRAGRRRRLLGAGTCPPGSRAVAGCADADAHDGCRAA